MKIEAAQRLLAAKASRKDAVTFLTELGFNGLKLKDTQDQLIKFWYKSYDPRTVEKYLDNPFQSTSSSIRYNFGTLGVVAIWPNNKTVVLKNADTTSTRVIPTETHVPPQIEKPHVVPTKEAPPVSPNTPGSTENDNTQVPVVHVSPELDAAYLKVQAVDSPTARLLFNKRLWLYLNQHKFDGKMQLPTLKLLKNQSATSMRLRGRWWPGKRVLEVAPRLYNASFAFFKEVFLHECCHQAVSEIDRINETVNKGHGPTWAKWMRHVGLNPLRFDPNDNATYMTKDELVEHQKKKDEANKVIQLNEQLKEQKGLRRTFPDNNKLVTVVRDGKAIVGMLVLKHKRMRGIDIWACINEEQIARRLAGSSLSWMNVMPSEIYAYEGSRESIFAGAKEMWDIFAKQIREHYARR